MITPNSAYASTTDTTSKSIGDIAGSSISQKLIEKALPFSKMSSAIIKNTNNHTNLFNPNKFVPGA